MAWKTFVIPLAIAPRRRIVAMALVYGLSLTVRFTSAAGGETENPPQPAQRSLPSSILIKGGAPTISRDWGAMSTQPIVFRTRRSVFKSRHAACERAASKFSKPETTGAITCD